MQAQAFKGSVVLITGGTRGIGAAIAADYARAGADLVITGRSQSTLDASIAALKKIAPSVRAQAVVGDISKLEVSKRAVKTAVDTFGKLDIVVANSAVLINDSGST